MAVACSNKVAEEKRTFQNACWSMNDTLHVSLKNEGTDKNYALQANIEFTRDFPYRNLYLRVKIVSPSGDENILNYSFEVMDDQGEWLTKGGRFEFPLSRRESFPAYTGTKKKYRFPAQ